MGTVNAWGKTYPGWAKPAIDAIKTLDAMDAPATGNRFDGKFHNIDLKRIADAYVSKYSAHQPGFTRIFESASGLMRYANDGGSAEKNAIRKTASLPLADALLEGANALLAGRQANYNAIAGFQARYIDVEFASYLNTIQSGSVTTSQDTWKAFWQQTLESCRVDMFVNSDRCAFN